MNERKFHRFLIASISRDVGTEVFFAGFTALIAKSHKTNASHSPRDLNN
jgi:hypothetical protein